MFRRLLASLARIFRLPRCRGSSANAGPAARQPTSELSPRLVSQPERIPTERAHSPSVFTPPSPILLSSVITPPVPDTLTPILIIGRDPAPSTPPPPPPAAAPTPPCDIGSPAAGTDTDSLQDTPLSIPHPNAARRVSFQLPPSTADQRPATPLSTCSTLVPDAKTTAEGGAEMSPVTPERPPRPETPDLDCVPPLPTAYDGFGLGMDSGLRARSGRTTPVSLYSPRPARRVNASRFSLPATPTVPMMPDTRARPARRDSRRASLLSLIPGTRTPKREKRASRWSRELTMSEAEDLLRLLREL